jgi:enolase
MNVAHLKAREVLDSRGNPTVEVEVHCHGGAWGRAIVPSGASTGRHEAVELRDGEPRYRGKGVRRAVQHVHTDIAPRLVGLDVREQAALDGLLRELDGTPNKSRLGANTILGVSLAAAHAGAAAKGVPLWQHLDVAHQACLPLPMINMISGGLHAGGQLAFQDFLLLPIGAATFPEALEMAFRVYRRLGDLLRQRGHEADLVGDEGGYGPKLRSNQEAVELLIEAIAAAGFQPGLNAGIALDVASTHFHENGRYALEGESLTSAQLIARLVDWVERFPILSIEDGLAEDDWIGWRELTSALGHTVQLIGDDLFTTHPNRLQRGILEGVANSVLVKLNQIGTLTETLDVIRLAQPAGYAPVISARSGETEDTTMADLAVGTGAGQIKIGCIVRGERLAKYNQLLRLAEVVPRYAGARALANGVASAPRALAAINTCNAPPFSG